MREERIGDKPAGPSAAVVALQRNSGTRSRSPGWRGAGERSKTFLQKRSKCFLLSTTVIQRAKKFSELQPRCFAVALWDGEENISEAAGGGSAAHAGRRQVVSGPLFVSNDGAQVAGVSGIQLSSRKFLSSTTAL